MNRQEVLEELEPVRGTAIREIEHTPATRIQVTPDMVTFRPGRGGRTLEMTAPGVASMATFLGIPLTLAEHCRPETFGQVATELLAHKNRYALVVKEGAVTALARHRQFNPVNPERVLTAIERGVPGLEYHKASVMEGTSVALEVIGDRRQPVRRGDMIRAGANITFSPLGTELPQVMSYVLRLICTNGMTDNTILRQFSYGGGQGGGEGDDIYQWFRNSAREAYGALDQVVRRYQDMLTERIPADQRALLLEGLLREAGIRGREAEEVRARALEAPPRNTYELMNLVSEATSHRLESPRQVRRAQTAVANFVHSDTHSRSCPVCHARRN